MLLASSLSLAMYSTNLFSFIREKNKGTDGSVGTRNLSSIPRTYIQVKAKN